MKKLRIISTAATIMIMIVIFSFSAQTREESSALSTGITQRFIDFIALFIKMSATQKAAAVSSIHWLIRKVAHFIIYFSLGISSSAMAFSYLGKKLKNASMLLISVAFCFLNAVSDEIHQAFTAGRGPMVRDVFLDTAGALAGALVFLLILKLFAILKEKKHD